MTKDQLIKEMSGFEISGFKPIVDKGHPKEDHLYIIWEMGNRFQVYLHILSHASFDREKCAIVRNPNRTLVVTEIHCNYSVVKIDRIDLSEIVDIGVFKNKITSKVIEAIFKDNEELKSIIKNNKAIMLGFAS